MQIKSLIVVVVMGLLSLTGCNQDTENAKAHGRSPGEGVEVNQKYSGDYPIKVVCTTGMVADLVRNVGGDRVEESHFMGAGVDPHQYQASPGDMSALNAADIVFYSGLHLEGKMSDVFVRMARRKPTFAVTEYIQPERVLNNEEGAFDPHLWFDVALWSQAVGVVRDVLAQYDPSNAELYKKNAQDYQAQLNKLHDETKQRLAEIPQPQRVLITAHDAFNYFGRAYNVEVRGIQGISTVDEPGVRHINELVDFITKRKIKAVFVETSVSEEKIKALVEGCHAAGHQVVIGGELFSDAMGPSDTPEGTYPGMIRHNVNTIVNALK